MAKIHQNPNRWIIKFKNSLWNWPFVGADRFECTEDFRTDFSLRNSDFDFSVEEMLEAAEMAEQAEQQQAGDVSNEVIVWPIDLSKSNTSQMAFYNLVFYILSDKMPLTDQNCF